MTAPHDLLADRYRVVRQVGSGGMGVVWEAWDERLERPVAVKQLRAQLGHSEAEAELAKNRAMREARITARLHHRHAVPVFDVVEHEGQPCLIMQFLPSVPLSAVLKESGPLEVHEAAQVGAQVASALAAAHQLDIVHRDVKPGNILIADDGSALISDFGISHALGDATLTSTGLVHGTPAYLAPEVARGGESGFASDVFSLGATLYAALEGSPPFGTDPNSIALLHRVAAGDFPPPHRAGPLAPLLQAMLANDPEDRPAMREVAARLAAVGPAPGPTAPTVLLPAASAAVAPTAAEPAPTPPAEPPASASAPAPTALLPGAAPPPASPTLPPAAAPVAPEGGAGRRRGPTVLLALVLLVGLALGVVALLRTLPGQGGGAADPVATPTTSAPASSAPASPTPRASASPSPRRTPSPSATPSPSPTPSRTPTPTPTPTSTATSGGGGDLGDAGDRAAAVRDYYVLVPGDTDAAWSRLTGRYQSGTAGGRQSFERFWGSIERVRVSGARGTGSDGAEATITYDYEDGRTVVERTSYRLRQDDGVLKIDGSTVITSTTR